MLWSPANVKLTCAPELEIPAVLLELAGRSRLQGTATCLPSPEELVEPNELVVLDCREVRLLAPVPVLELEVSLVPPELELLELSERMAKSALPEEGLMMTSLTVPMAVSPELPFTSAPISLVTQTSW